jgi:hypothetical protein
MAEPIVPAYLFQQALFETMKASAEAAQGNQFGMYHDPTKGAMPTIAPVVLNRLANGNNFNV